MLSRRLLIALGLVTVSVITTYYVVADDGRAYPRNDSSFHQFGREYGDSSGQQQGGDSSPSAKDGGPAESSQYPDIITVEESRTGTSVVLGGTVVPYKEVTLTAQIPGRIEYISGTEGDWFQDGTVLVAINDDDLLAQRRQVLAQLANAETVLRNAQVQYSREMYSPQSRNINRAPGMGMPSLFDQFFTRNLGSMAGTGEPWLDRQADLYSYGARIGQARSDLLAAKSRLEEVDARLRDTRSIAPFDGVVTKKLVEVGDTVQPGQALLHFADTRYLQIQVDVPARLMPGLRMGMMVPSRLDVGNTRVQARVAQIFPMADVARHTVTVKLDLPIGVPGGPGMYAEVMMPDINVPARSVPVIPYSAVVWRGSLPAVFVMNAENRTELRLIRLGEPVDNERVSVLSGLRAGERIFAKPKPGMASGWSPGAGPAQAASDGRPQ
jgi:multidrug efflux pump subunit AcrA (membrane-fusion protein)